MATKTKTCTCKKTTRQPNVPTELFPTSGRLGDTVYYMVDGKPRKRGVGNMNRQRFQTDPVFENSRNAKDEFTAAINIATTIRQALNPYARELGKWPLHNRLTAAVHEKLKATPGVRCRKELPITQLLQNLRTFQFRENAKSTLRDYAHIRTSTIPVLGTQHIEFELMSPNHRQPIPKYVTHIRPVCITMAISDYKWDGRQQKYRPQNPSHGTRAIQYGPMIAVKGNRPDQSYPTAEFYPSKILQEAPTVPSPKKQKGLAQLTAIALEFLELDQQGKIHRTTTTSLEILSLLPFCDPTDHFLRTFPLHTRTQTQTATPFVEPAETQHSFVEPAETNGRPLPAATPCDPTDHTLRSFPLRTRPQTRTPKPRSSSLPRFAFCGTGCNGRPLPAATPCDPTDYPLRTQTQILSSHRSSVAPPVVSTSEPSTPNPLTTNHLPSKINHYLPHILPVLCVKNLTTMLCALSAFSAKS